MLATWDLDLDFGIMITHKILAMKLLINNDGDGLFVILSLSFHNNVVTKIALNLNWTIIRAFLNHYPSNFTSWKLNPFHSGLILNNKGGWTIKHGTNNRAPL